MINYLNKLNELTCKLEVKNTIIEKLKNADCFDYFIKDVKNSKEAIEVELLNLITSYKYDLDSIIEDELRQEAYTDEDSGDVQVDYLGFQIDVSYYARVIPPRFTGNHDSECDPSRIFLDLEVSVYNEDGVDVSERFKYTDNIQL